MRKRLRKKKYLGEFKEYGVHLIIRFDKTSRDLDAFLDAFIVEAIEANGCFTAAGGDCNGDLLDAFIELGLDRDNPMARLEAIRVWVLTQPDILAHSFSPATDAWYGPFYEFGEEMKPIQENG